MRLKLKFGEKHLILLATLLLGIIGLIFIYSASSYSAERDFSDAFYYVKKQGLAFIGGIVVMIFGAKLKLDWLKKAAWFIYGGSIILLALVFIPGLGVESYGATRWLNLGFTTIQPSEFSKFGLMIFLAAYMTDHPPVNLKAMIIPLICGMSMCLLIMLEPNMSITMCVVMALIILIYVAGSQRKWFVFLIAAIAVAVPLLIILEPYRVKRLFAFIDPWANPKNEGYQLIQSYYALGSGGLFGVGLFASRQKYLFLPFAESDFIFSVIGEETGLFGCIGVIIIFATLIIVGIRVAMNAKCKYHTLLAAGLVSVIALQTIINMAVVTGSIPPTGVPLPYVSAGGTSLVTFMFVSGLLYNIASVTNVKDLP